VKPGKADLFKILLKYIVASGDLTINRFEEGVPILRRGDTTEDVTATSYDVTADVTATALAQETDLTIGSQSESQVPVSVTATLPRADTHAASACRGETRQGGVREGYQDRAGEVAD
jgi:hypothetical protein